MRITRRLEFDAGHRIPDHASQCRHLHGHRYALEITLSGDTIKRDGSPVNGMVMDFGDVKAIVPSAKKVGGLGANIDIPITHIHASYVRSHFDAIEVNVPDAPRADEIVLILSMTTGSRVHARVGGLAVSDIKGEDGLR